MGSSTAAGSNATSYATSWVGKMTAHFQQNMSDGLDTVVYNIAEYGYSTYHEMPTGFVQPPSRPASDPDHNVTRALSYTPDIVIINLPSNDIAFGYSKQEMMDNLRLMYATITATGAKCFIGTTAPRNDITNAQALQQRELVDSINMNFGVFAINFWDDLVTNDGQNRLKDEVRYSGSLYHLNDAGHDYMFLRVRDKQIFLASSFPLPILLTGFEAAVKNNSVVLKWSTLYEEPNTHFEIQRSKDGSNFETIQMQAIGEPRQSASYTTTDKSPLTGKSFYRLKINEAGRIIYSAIVSVQLTKQTFTINRVFLEQSSGNVIAEVSSQHRQPAIITIISANGSVLYQQQQQLQSANNRISIPVGTLAAGHYYLRVQADGTTIAVKAFSK